MRNIKSELEALDCRYRLDGPMREEIIRRRLDGESQASIAAHYEVHQSSISRIMTQYLRSLPPEAIDHAE